MHDRCLREVLQAHGGTELLSEGDAFLLCFTEPVNAIRFSLEVQERLLAAKWPPKMQSSSHEAIKVQYVTGERVFSGLRVRMSAHIGVLQCNSIGQLLTDPLLSATRQIGTICVGGQVHPVLTCLALLLLAQLSFRC